MTFVVMGLFGCQYQDSRVNVNFADKSLIEIQNSITGRWQVHYVDGGLNGRQDTDSFFLTLSKDRIKSEFEGNLIKDDSLTWFNSQFMGDPAWTMEFDKHFLLPSGIFNDTLRLQEPYINGPMFHLTRVRQ